MPKRSATLENEDLVNTSDVEEVEVRKHAMFGFVIYLKIDGEHFRVSKTELAEALRTSDYNLMIRGAKPKNKNGRGSALRLLEKPGTRYTKVKKKISKFESTIGD